MGRLDILRQKKNHKNIEQAIKVLNNDELDFVEKHKQILALEQLSSGSELEEFGDIYSSLHLQVLTDEEAKLLAGE